jgi:hypothetical protein
LSVWTSRSRIRERVSCCLRIKLINCQQVSGGGMLTQVLWCNECHLHNFHLKW